MQRPDFVIPPVGLGFRRELIGELWDHIPEPIGFFEIAPENWMDMGGSSAYRFKHFVERIPFVAHGLSLSLGGPSPLDEVFLRRVKGFLDAHHIPLYSEHLSYCSDDGQLYDLLPIPFTGDAVRYVAGRIRRTQEILERPIAIENASFYVWPEISEMSELDFVLAVLEEADCWLHLDVNNVYVNSVNHRYDPRAFIDRIPAERVVYMHVAGHYQEHPRLLVDTHGAPVIDPVWDLLRYTVQRIGCRPTCLERDFNLPPLAELVDELQAIARIQATEGGAAGTPRAVANA